MKLSSLSMVVCSSLLWLAASQSVVSRAMAFSKVLTDADHNVSVKKWKLTSDEMGDSSSPTKWSVTKRILSGGRQQGVEVIEVDNGARLTSPSFPLAAAVFGRPMSEIFG
jgi:hypothetical protein